MIKDVSRIALGTAQFGFQYGIANRSGQVALDEVETILARARAYHIDTLDTAIAYGDSELRLGTIGVGEWNVISKLPAVPDGCDNISRWVEESVIASLNRLKIPRLYGLLLHHPKQLLESRTGPQVYMALQELKLRGLILKMGYSIYNPEELDLLWERFPPDLVQVPLNVFDQRMVSCGWLKRLYSANVEIHARSVFLQGLLLMSSDSRPAYFSQWEYLFESWDYWLRVNNYTALEACIHYLLGQEEINRIVVGVDSARHFAQIIMVASSDRALPPLPAHFSVADPALINPSNWNR